MRFLPKPSTALEPHRALSYPQDRNAAFRVLVGLQRGFCAYSERWLKPMDSAELEHFDPRLKNTDQDGIANWHAVLRFMNAHKARKIEAFLPLPDPATWSPERARYARGEFVCDEADVETGNLIEFLGVNRPEVYEERARHVARLRRMKLLLGDAGLLETLEEHPEELSFPTAIEAELGVPAFEIIARAAAPEFP